VYCGVLAKLQTFIISVPDGIESSQTFSLQKRRGKSHIRVYALGVLLGELQNRSEHGGEEEHTCPGQEPNSSHELKVTERTYLTQLIMSVEGTYS
jgi:hypothetical protein